MKSPERMALLQERLPTPGTYACTVPGCDVRQNRDGLCPRHDVPLRLVKAGRS